MAAVTTTSTATRLLCPAAGHPSWSSSNRSKTRGRRKLQAKTICQCRSAWVEGVMRRREAVLSILLSGMAAAALPVLVPADALAETTELQERGFSTYEDEVNKFQIAVPQGWQVGAGEANGIKSVTAFYPEQDADSNVSVVITGIGPDFTSLKSFGDVDAFAENLVNGLDRSWQRPPGLAAKLVDSKAANGLYYVEYTLQNPGERRRHIVSAIGMAFNGWYNRLYTVTGQYIDGGEEADKYRPQIEKAVKSFKLT